MHIVGGFYPGVYGLCFGAHSQAVPASLTCKPEPGLQLGGGGMATHNPESEFLLKLAAQPQTGLSGLDLSIASLSPVHRLQFSIPESPTAVTAPGSP